MKKHVLAFLITLLATITAFSSNISREIENDSIVSITSEQLKETNLIFVEHAKLLKENSLLVEQLDNYIVDVRLLKEADSIRVLQIENYKAMMDSYQDHVKELNKEIKKKERLLLGIEIGGVTIAAGLLLLLLLK